MKLKKIYIKAITVIVLFANISLSSAMDVSGDFPKNLNEAVEKDDLEAVKYYLEKGEDPLERNYGNIMFSSGGLYYDTPLKIAVDSAFDKSLLRDVQASGQAMVNLMLEKADPARLDNSDFIQLLSYDQFDLLRALVKKRGVRSNQLELAFIDHLSTIETEEGQKIRGLSGKKFNPQIVDLAAELGLDIFELEKKLAPSASKEVKNYFINLKNKFAGLAFAASDPTSYLTLLPIDLAAHTLGLAVLQRPLTPQERKLFGLIFSARTKEASSQKLTPEELEAWSVGAEAYANSVKAKLPTVSTAAAAATTTPPVPAAPTSKPTAGTLSSTISDLKTLWSGKQ